jgi:hypothetical protein
MTEPSEPAPDIAAAVQALTPQLTRLSLLALLGIAALGLAMVAGVSFALGFDDDQSGDRFKIVLFVLLAGGLLCAFTYRWMRRQQESLVMPVVARAVGLTYQKDGTGFLRSLPPRLLPRHTQRRAEDYVTGRLGRHEIRMAEVEVETGGKNSRTLFKGLVVEFRNQVPMPAFFLASPEQTAPGVLFGGWINVDDLHHLRDLSGPSGGTYGLWTSTPASAEPPGLALAAEGVVALDHRIPAPVTLFTATSTGEEMHLALSHQRNLYQIGGFFPQGAQVLADVQIAAADLSIALSLAQELIALEATVAAAAA